MTNLPQFVIESLNLSNQGEQDAALDKMMDGMDDLMHAGDWLTLDSIFKEIDCRKINLSLSLLLVCYTPNEFPSLPSRVKFLKELINKFGERQTKIAFWSKIVVDKSRTRRKVNYATNYCMFCNQTPPNQSDCLWGAAW